MSTTMQGFSNIKKKTFKLPADEQNNVKSKKNLFGEDDEFNFEGLQLDAVEDGQP